MKPWSGRPLTQLRELLWASREHTCHLCKQPIETFTDMHIDHLYPRSTHPHLTWDPSAMALAHKQCNLQRGTKELTEYKRIKPSRVW